MNILKNLWTLFFYLIIYLLLAGCAGGYFVTNYTTYYTAVYMSHTELRESFQVKAAQELYSPGKIVVFGDYIFLNDQDKGIHIIDNKNPQSPLIITFLKIPGNYDLAIKDGYLYADSFIDIVVIDIRGLPDNNSISLITRLENVIPYNSLRNIGELMHDNHAGIFYRINDIDHSKGVVIGWQTEVKSSEQWIPYGAKFSPPASKGGTGMAGSMTRFMVQNNFLYTVDEVSLNVFSLATPEQPVFLTSQKVDQGRSIIETIFAYNKYLFLGSQSGMYVFSIEQEADKPRFTAFLRHMPSFDPVIVHNNLAYVTLLMGELQIIDISNIQDPKLLTGYRCDAPLGLSIDMPYLFISTKKRLLVYDVTDPLNLKMLTNIKYQAGSGYDVIANHKRLFVVTTEGLFQYDYSNIDNIILLSSIQIKQSGM